MSGGVPSLYIPHGVQPKTQPANTPSPTTSTPTNTPVPQFTVTGSRSDTQSSASSASQSPPVTTPTEPEAAAAKEQGPSLNSEGASESEGKDDRDENRVDPYVDFTDFFRQVAEFGEDFVYGFDKDITQAAA